VKTVSATSARADLYNLIDSTLYLLNIPGMRDSLLEGMAEDLEECSEEIDLCARSA
jgi:antitoxin YefM